MSEQKTQAAQVAAVRFEDGGKIYHFSCSNLPDLQLDDFVIVTTSRGQEMAQVAKLLESSDSVEPKNLKPVERLATAQELVMRRLWQRRDLEALIECRALASDLKLKHIKIARASFSFDGSSLTIFYNTESEEKVDLKHLRQALRRTYRQSRVDFKSIGPRDLAKIIGGLGACGLVERCCTRFLSEFSPISIKMAKAQGISLNPQEITGMCGRLRCCLVYEYDQYVAARKQLPKIKKRVLTPQGEGRVIDVLALKDAVRVQLTDGQRVEFSREEIEPWDELQALKEKAMAPCGKHEAGGCTCKPARS